MISRYLMQGMAGVCVILLIVTGVLWLSNKSARAERDVARQNWELALSANQSLQESMRQLQAEKVLADEMRAELAKELEQIRRTTRATIDRQAREIAQLRRDYEAVADYHSAVAPDEHIDWVCQQIGSCPD